MLRNLALLIILVSTNGLQAEASAVLHYFDGRGRANPIRFLLEETGQPYTEEPIRFLDDLVSTVGKLCF